MERIFALIMITFISIDSNAQNRCELKSLSKQSKMELLIFWSNFRKSVAQRDTSELLKLCDFPFKVDKEILSNKRDPWKSYKLDSTSIKKYTSILFFEKQFTESLAISTNPVDNLKLHGDYNKKHRTCFYEYFYLVKDKDGQDQLRSFSIVRIDSSYKITSNWIRY